MTFLQMFAEEPDEQPHKDRNQQADPDQIKFITYSRDELLALRDSPLAQGDLDLSEVGDFIAQDGADWNEHRADVDASAEECNKIFWRIVYHKQQLREFVDIRNLKEFTCKGKTFRQRLRAEFSDEEFKNKFVQNYGEAFSHEVLTELYHGDAWLISGQGVVAASPVEGACAAEEHPDRYDVLQSYELAVAQRFKTMNSEYGNPCF